MSDAPEPRRYLARSHRRPAAAVGVRQQQKEATRARVLDAARELFDTQGYQGTTIREIARHAGVSVGSVFTCYASKGEILSAVMDERLEGLYAELDRVVPHLRGSVADRLRLPVVSQISELEVADGTATAKRQTEYGYDTIATPLPAVLAVADSLNEPRYPSLKGIMGAKKKPQEVKTLADVGVEAERAGEAGSRTTVAALADPPSRGDTVKIEDDGSGAQKILEFLVERKLV